MDAEFLKVAGDFWDIVAKIADNLAPIAVVIAAVATVWVAILAKKSADASRESTNAALELARVSAEAARKSAEINARLARPIVATSNSSIREEGPSSDGNRVFVVTVDLVNSGATTAFGVTLIPTVGLPMDDGSISSTETEPSFISVNDLIPNREVAGYFKCSMPRHLSGAALLGWVVIWRDEAARFDSLDTYLEFDDLGTAQNSPVSVKAKAWLTGRLESLRKLHFPSVWDDGNGLGGDVGGDQMGSRSVVR